MNSRLNLNLGLRWEPYFAPYDQFGRATHFDEARYAGGQKSTVFTNGPAGITFAGDPGMPRGGTNSNYGNFAPRIGLVFDPQGNGKMTLRTSYSLSYDLPTMQVFDRMGIASPWGSSITLNAPVGGFTDPYLDVPGGNPFPTPLPPPSNIRFAPQGQYPTFPFDVKMMYTQSWSLALQRQLGADWVVSASYIGNKSTNRWLNVRDNGAVFLPGATVANIQQRRRLSLINPTEGQLIGSLTRKLDPA